MEASTRDRADGGSPLWTLVGQNPELRLQVSLELDITLILVQSGGKEVTLLARLSGMELC